MKIETTILTTERDDLEKFILLFEPSKYKRLKNGIEVRGQPDLESNVATAKALVLSLGLHLTIISDANMATYRAFEVRQAY
ncbi:hypothetical protein [Pedobacter caeni]|uniref:Uncharacterized protein n=1 Tax=Pedobacter caeni TaxID=288992 RepID=A0A1M5GXS1_9SPHI|nr:hypothetical protein [Pedobacter caeni]SHG08415.1 hypothetical protein SAMN04488522_104411 [Pedobacter caeni]